MKGKIKRNEEESKTENKESLKLRRSKRLKESKTEFESEKKSKSIKSLIKSKSKIKSKTATKFKSEIHTSSLQLPSSSSIKSYTNLKNVLYGVKNRQDFREWLLNNHETETECWAIIKRGKLKNDSEPVFLYLDAVEEALCFGWIDSTIKKVNGIGCLQRFTPRKKKSSWSELNKERCRRLEKLGYMTPAGRDALPDLSDNSFIINEEILQELKKDPETWENFQKFPGVYQRVKIDNIQKVKNIDNSLFNYRLKKFIENTKKNIMYGEWNDNGRLLNY